MELRQLKYFVKVGELLSFSEAARELFISQSTLSQQIRSLEGELRCTLLLRDSHSVALTEEGRYFLEDARQTLLQAQQCVDRIADVQKLEEGTLNIGCTYSFGPIMSQTILDFAERHPNIRMNVSLRTMEEVMVMLQKQVIDVALSYKPSERYDNISSHILFDNKLCVFVSDSHPLARKAPKSSVTPAQMQNLRFVMPAKGMQARNLFELLIAAKGYAMDIRMEINEVNILLNLVRSGRFATVLSQAADFSQGGLACLPIDVADNNIEGCCHILRGKYVKRSAKEFIKILQEKNASNLMRHRWLDFN